VTPDEKAVTGFIFKVQANMDKKHRDRIAFMRLCSGDFKRGMKLRQVRTGKDVMVHSPIIFLAQDREIAEEAGAGDVIGIPNHGTIRVGDTFTEGEELRFTGLPVFAPEILRRMHLVDTTRIKQLRQALQDLSEEGLSRSSSRTSARNGSSAPSDRCSSTSSRTARVTNTMSRSSSSRPTTPLRAG
jgi:peptide chain release factor 3